MVASELPDSVRIREVGPRDGFQNEPEVIPTEVKVELIDALARTGVPRMEITSFVRPDVIPHGTANLAFVGQYCEIPDNVVYTVEYSIHAAALAVASLLGAPGMVPPAYQGLDHPHALVGAIRRVLE